MEHEGSIENVDACYGQKVENSFTNENLNERRARNIAVHGQRFRDRQERANEVEGYGRQPKSADYMLARLVTGSTGATDNTIRTRERRRWNLTNSCNGDVEEKGGFCSEEHRQTNTQHFLFAKKGVGSNRQDGLCAQLLGLTTSKNPKRPRNSPDPKVAHMQVAAMTKCLVMEYQYEAAAGI